MEDFKRECLRCGHVWVKRQTTEPVSCPKCGSPLWNQERKNKKGAGRPKNDDLLSGVFKKQTGAAK